jgi:hypothetical protein
MKAFINACGFFLLLIMSVVAFAQSTIPFEALSIDRPDVSNLPTTVRPGHYQFEIGSERGHGMTLKEFHIPNMVFRTGITSKSELRIGYDFLRLDSTANGSFDNIMFLMLGGKYRFVEESGARPSMALQAEFALPVGAGAGIGYDRDDYNLAAYSFLLLFNNTLHEQVFITYNAGLFWSRRGLLDWLVSASFSFIHTQRIGYYMEIYSLILDGQAPVSFDAGLMFLVSPRFQVDIYGGQKSFEFERLWFYGAGLGFRIDRGDLKPKTFREIGIHH